MGRPLQAFDLSEGALSDGFLLYPNSDCRFWIAGLHCWSRLRWFFRTRGAPEVVISNCRSMVCNPGAPSCKRSFAHIPAQGGNEGIVKKSLAKIDILLEPLLSEANDQKADELLMELITVYAEPVIRGIIRYKLHLNPRLADGRAEAEDIYQEVLLQLLAELQQLRKQPDEHPITDVRGMAAVIAHRNCSRWMRRQFPERHALKNRLQYLLTRQRGLALWQDKDRNLVAGFAAWEGQKTTVAPTRLGQLTDDERLMGHIQTLKTGRPQELGEALSAIFNHLGGPVGFDELVSTLAALLGIRNQPLESLAEDEDAVAFQTAAGEPDQAWQVEKRIFLQRLWEELQQLPRNQRAALLLNLKDADGRGCIALFPATGIVTLRQLAEALEMSADHFAQLWNELPLEDARIAELLGLTRQQVINARKSGRERLTRRLKGFI
jgi:RNA polymerase sigma factor (sigma-70 family)